jgi:ribosomal protein S18 acetylase RimI-like enzyme
LTAGLADEVELVTVPQSQRSVLLPILEESFEGMYLWHSKRTLQGIELVRELRVSGERAGLSMLKMVAAGAGYVYYIAVSARFRRRGLGGMLLDDALSHFLGVGADEVFASVEEDNVESNALFSSRGFVRTDRSFIASRYGQLRSLLMYREMMIVPGEVVLRKTPGSSPPVTEAPPDGATPLA